MSDYFINGDVIVDKLNSKRVFVYFSGNAYQIYDRHRESIARKATPSKYEKIGELHYIFYTSMKQSGLV